MTSSVSPSSVQRAADDIDLDIGTAIGERDPAAETAAAQATDRNLALHTDATAIADTGTGSTQEMTQGRMAAARFGGLNEGITQESPTIEQPLAGANGAATVRQKVEKVLQQSAHVDQTSELAIDDLGLDLNALDTVDQPALGAGADAPTMIAGLDERSRRLLETAEHRTPDFGLDPAEDADRLLAVRWHGHRCTHQCGGRRARRGRHRQSCRAVERSGLQYRPAGAHPAALRRQWTPRR